MAGNGIDIVPIRIGIDAVNRWEEQGNRRRTLQNIAGRDLAYSIADSDVYKRQVLGLSELNMYDLYCPMVENIDLHLTFEEARELVFAATAPLGEEYHALLQRAFDERWIDVYENKGKTTGAFSCGVYGVHPYVLMNFARCV